MTGSKPRRSDVWPGVISDRMGRPAPLTRRWILVVKWKEDQKTIQWGLLRKSFQIDAGAGLAGRFSTNDQISSMAAASFLRFIAMAVRRAWIFMFSSPLRTARARPWSVLAVPCAPSTCHRWRV